ncbi:MAG: hypothetical protein PHD67_00075 [Oscillospiraceae bacterium]|nr:hypothetical protein [Oscillospiraceae bacterium]
MKKFAALLFLLPALIALSAGCSAEKMTTEVSAQKYYFEATVLEVQESALLVEPDAGTDERKSADQIVVGTADVGEEGSLQYLGTAAPGDRIRIGYLGGIAESYPAQIDSAFELSLLERAPEFSKEPLPMVMVDGKLYGDANREIIRDGRCGVMDGEIRSTVDIAETPSENGQSNFGSGYGYQYGPEDSLEICIDGTLKVFELLDENGGQAIS